MNQAHIALIKAEPDPEAEKSYTGASWQKIVTMIVPC
jgi:hypothetical protein